MGPWPVGCEPEQLVGMATTVGELESVVNYSSSRKGKINVESFRC